MEKAKLKIERLEVRKQNILTKFKEEQCYSVDGIIQAGKELELLRVKIWAIEEAIYG
tara:strand:+ start:307 stop:477 length:171 start_codon:yes stop_codon:yes gene_type:complete